ncbi:photosynthetic complex putative assembly protein PuhB [Stappia sp. ES.058]|uniref:photosynthetic complex putative assembly protein PuhB n=1 Tax=Stappia sp. ES.058 TaxID=1881061 RepID=UPI00087C7E5D|nr:photosynthetic complex putative assembly protein PuhB [Stappia sp. ES.058]SDT96210.1 PH domain-containing protein [Stappia sp. ES.058]
MSGQDKSPEHDFEPVPGLPEDLPEGEFILWQGRPEMRHVARRVLKTRWIAAYFLAIVGWALVAGYYDGRPLGYVLFSAGALTTMAAIVLILAEGFAWAINRTTLYTITNARVVLRIGVALSVTFNLPYAEIVEASVDRRSDGSGTIALKLKPDVRLSWLILWPHARGWRFAHPEPAMICLPDVVSVAGLLAKELKTQVGGSLEASAEAAVAAANRPTRAVRGLRQSASLTG